MKFKLLLLTSLFFKKYNSLIVSTALLILIIYFLIKIVLYKINKIDEGKYKYKNKIFEINLTNNYKEKFEENNILLVCYSHSSYFPVLNAHNEYLKNIPNKKFLFIDKILPEHVDLCFDKIIFYDNNLNYTKRLYNSFKQIDEDIKYIIFTHDNDILIKIENDKINNIVSIMDENIIDRVCLQIRRYESPPSNTIIFYNNDFTLDYLDKYYFCQTPNPSIWKLTSLIKIHNEFDRDYRGNETLDIQDFCKKNFKVYYIHSNNDNENIKTTRGFDVCNFYIFIKITSACNIIRSFTIENPKNENEKLVLNEYNKIIQNIPIDINNLC